MRKIITLLILLFSLLFSSDIFSQVKKNKSSAIDKKQLSVVQKERLQKRKAFRNNLHKNINNIHKPLAIGDCQVIEPAFEDFQYLITSDEFEDAVTGLNSYYNQQIAEYADFSGALVNNYINGVAIYFAEAYAGDDDYTREVPVNIYDGTSGQPGALLGTAYLTLENIVTDIDNEDATLVDFPGGIALPASKKIFISLDFINLSYDDGDFLGIFSSDADELPVNTAWEQWEDGDWYAINDPGNWDISLSLAMAPVVGESPVCTQLVPVKLISLNANTFGAGNKVEWTAASEINNKGYEVERSSDGVSYSKIGYLNSQSQPGSNNAAVLKYSFVDNTPIAQKSFYRLKQIDLNGNITYSKIVVVSRTKTINAGLVQVYPNPVRNSLNLVADVPANKAASVIISDITGKTLMQQILKSNGTNQNVSFNVSSLSKGTYLVRLNGEGSNKLIKFVKQ